MGNLFMMLWDSCDKRLVQYFIRWDFLKLNSIQKIYENDVRRLDQSVERHIASSKNVDQ